MTIIEALQRSKETGESFCRVGSIQPGDWPGWIAYDSGHTYKLTGRDLLGEWESTTDWKKYGGGR